MSKLKLFDIETGPAPDSELAGVEPEFKAPGNYKDAEKIKANIAEQREKWKDDAALSPVTGRIVSIAFCDASDIGSFEEFGVADNSESQLIEEFFDRYSKSAGGSSYKLAGWNVKDFDLGFIIKRAWFLGIKVPFSLMPTGTRKFYWPNNIIDLREIWGLAEYRPSGSLDIVGRAFGLGSKQGHGSRFAKLYADPETRYKALEYQKSEMSICCGLCDRFGLLEGGES